MRIVPLHAIQAAGAAALLVTAAWSCSSTQTTSTPGTSSDAGSGSTDSSVTGTDSGGSALPSSASIGPSGGSVGSPDGHLQVSIPAGALASTVTITVTTTIQSGSLGTAYDIEPSGTQFAVPVAMTASYAGLDLGGTAPSDLRISVYGSSGWQTLAGQALDMNAQTVSGTTTHLSTYALTAAPQTQTCFGLSSGGGGSSGGGSGGGSGSGSSGGGGPTDCTGFCTSYPGSMPANCTITPTGPSSWTYTTQCCFAVGAPTCVSVCGGSSSGGSSGGSTSGSGSSTSGSGGSSGGFDCSQVTCPAGGTPMCTSTASSFMASCCFAPGTSTGLTGGACGASGSGSGSSSGSSSSGGGSSGSGSSSGSSSSSSGGSSGGGSGGSSSGGPVDAGPG